MGRQLKKISVITVVLNDATGLEKTLRSVQENVANLHKPPPDSPPEQLCRKVEHIVIDGGSTDGTVEVIISHAASVAHWVSEPDKGIYDAMNKGLQAATGEWILFLNAGDTFTNEFVLQQVFSTDIPDAVVIYGDSIADYGDFRLYRKAGSPGELWKGMICSHQAMLFLRTKLPDAGYQMPDAGCRIPDKKYGIHDMRNGIRNPGTGIRDRIVADHELVLRLYLSGGSFVYKPFPFAVVETRGISNRKQVRSICQRYRMVKKSGELTGLRPVYYFYLWALAVIAECAYLVLPRKLVYFFIRIINRRSLISSH